MLASLLISLREGLEAALIVGIVLGYLRQVNIPNAHRYAWIGVGGAVLASALVAAGIQIAGAELEGEAEELFEGVTMLAAAGLLTWMIFWMRSHSKTLKSTLENDLNKATHNQSFWGITLVTFIAVFREGVETALFLGAAAFASDGLQVLVGALIGLGLAAVAGYLIFTSTVRLNLKRFFNVTSLLLLVFAAGLLAHGVHELQEVGVVPTVNEHVWNVSSVLSDDDGIGILLKTLFGYNASPSLEEVLAYVIYWIVILGGIVWWDSHDAASKVSTDNKSLSAA